MSLILILSFTLSLIIDTITLVFFPKNTRETNNQQSTREMAPTFLLMALLGGAAAQTTTISLPFIEWESMNMSASVISANPTATTVSLMCPKPRSAGDTDAECGLFPTQRLVYGPSTYMMEMGDPESSSSGFPAFTGTIDCALGKPTITCTESFGGSDANFPGVSSTEYPSSAVVSLEVIVTAGAEKLKAGAVSATTTPAPTGPASASGSGAISPTQVKGISAHVETAGAAPTNPAALGKGLIGAAAVMLGGFLV